jgi:hypothetical protein
MLARPPVEMEPPPNNKKLLDSGSDVLSAYAAPLQYWWTRAGNPSSVHATPPTCRLYMLAAGRPTGLCLPVGSPAAR